MGGLGRRQGHHVSPEPQGPLLRRDARHGRRRGLHLPDDHEPADRRPVHRVVLRGLPGVREGGRPDGPVHLEEGLLQITFEERIVDYEFNELDEIDLAYATSIHKDQGSEYPAVVIPMAMLHFMLLERNLPYTGVTQGKQFVVVIAQPKALAMAVKNQRSQRRMTHLIARLNQG